MALMDAASVSPDVAAPASAGGDLSQGYCIEVSVLPDGSYAVGAPGPLKEYADAQNFDSIGAALKGVLEVIKENPVAGDDNTQL